MHRILKNLLVILVAGSTVRSESPAKPEISLHSNGSSQLIRQHYWLRAETTQRDSKSEPIKLVAGSRLYSESDFFSSKNFDLVDWFINHQGQDNRNLTLLELFNLVVQLKSNSPPYGDIHLHSYETFEELRQSGGPKISQQVCIRQLNRLVERTRVATKQGHQSTDVNLFFLLDTFGRNPSSMLNLLITWLGSYSNCLNRRIIDPANGHIEGTRYCLASLARHSASAQARRAVKVAVCLPDSCDSINADSKYELINELVHQSSPQLGLLGLNVADLYCLPDEHSKLRTWTNSRQTVLFLSLVSGWLSLILYCTIKSLRSGDQTNRNSNASNSSNLTSKQQTLRHRIYHQFSLANSLKHLFATSEPTTPAESDTVIADKVTIDLRCIDGIKVLSMCYVIMGHVLMIMSSNVDDLLNRIGTLPSLMVSNLMPAFSVNAFFCITGILTTYQIFEHNLKLRFIYSPSKWFALIVMRYMRIMPLYIIVFAYTKTFAKYVGSGPLWDYGTSSLSQRRLCEKEPWTSALTFTANLKSPFDHCIPSAWYLANDFQFFLITPILIIPLSLNAKLGKQIIKLATLASFCSGFFGVLLDSQADDLRSITSFMPHAFKTYITFLAHNYTYPHNRISAYLIGVWFGHWLHEYKKARTETCNKPKEAPDTSLRLIRLGPYACLLSLALLYIIPLIGSRLRLGIAMGKFAIALLIPSYHIVFSLSIGAFILHTATTIEHSLIVKILQAPLWKPLAKLSLCAVLINIEIINILVQTQEYTPLIDAQYHISFCLVTFLATYVCAMILFALFESPIRSAQMLLLTRGVKQKLD